VTRCSYPSIPFKAKNPPESFPIVTVGLIAINVIVYAATTEYGLVVREDVVDQFAFKSQDFPSYTLLTSMFLHVDPFHLVGNMLFLWIFGFAVEGRMKPLKYTAMYFASGLCGDLLHHLVVGLQHPDVPSLGASGAIMGVVGAAMYVFPFAKIKMFYWIGWFWRGVAEWPMWCVGLYYLAFDIFFAALGLESGVANFAHIGGAGGGFLLAFAMRVRRDDSKMSEAKSNLDDMGNLLSLNHTDLEHLVRSNPENAEAALAWVWSQVRVNRPPCEESLQCLQRHIGAAVRTGGIREVADVLGEYAGRVGRFHPRYAIDAGLRAEREAEPQSALRLLEAARLNPHLTASDREIVFYQLAMLHESWFKNYGAAAHFDQCVMTEFGGSPLSDQAAARYRIVAPLAAQQGGAYKY
jgi:membrane associated rhomboid family serine protease